MRLSRFSFTDLVVVFCAIWIGLSLTLVRVGQHRAAARRSGCTQNLMKLGLALHNYHSAYRQMPMGNGGTSASSGSQPWQSNQDRLSALVALLPFYEEQRLWEQITNPIETADVHFPAMGPVPWYDPEAYSPWKNRPKLLVCPSESDANRFPSVASYVVNYGDAVHMVGSPYDPTSRMKARAMQASNRGLFFGKTPTEFRDCRDGLANTLMCSESCIAGDRVAKGVRDLALDPTNAIRASKDPTGKFWPAGREACWADGCLRSSGFQTILPPNSPSATSHDSDLEGVMSVSSHHRGGVHAVYADGHVQFILDSIDAGDSTTPTVATLNDREYTPPGSRSPYGLWGAIGTRASMENVNPSTSIIDPLPELEAAEIEKMQKQSLETWALRDSNDRQLQGWFVTIQREKMLIYLREDGDVGRLSLSDLVDEDSERIWNRYDATVKAEIAELKKRAELGVQLLDEKRFKDFAKSFLIDDARDLDQVAELVKHDRGHFIQALEGLIRELDNPQSHYVKREISGESPRCDCPPAVKLSSAA